MRQLVYLYDVGWVIVKSFCNTDFIKSVHDNKGQEKQEESKPLPAIFAGSSNKLSICNISALSFDRSKYHSVTAPSSKIPINNPLKVGYSPFITKNGSTRATKLLSEITMSEFVSDPLVVDMKDIRFFSFLRNPFDRVLVGYHQIQVFVHLGRIDSQIKRHKL